MSDTLLHAIVGVGTLGLFLLVFYGPWQAVCTDIARQLVFEKRDAIFDMAASGRLSFESEDYRRIRICLEGMIRFAHEATVPRMLVGLVVIGLRKEVAGSRDLDRAVAGIRDGATRSEVNRLVNEAVACLCVTMLLRSLCVLLLFPVSLAILCFFAICRNSATGLMSLAAKVMQAQASGTRPGTMMPVG